VKKTYLNGLLIAAAVLIINSAARADLTETVTMSFSGTSFIGKVTAPMKGFQTLSSSTIYKSGDKIKTVMLGRGQTQISIIDLSNKTVTSLFPAAKTEMVMPDQSLSAGNIPSAKVTDTKQIRMILGHKAHLFRFPLGGLGQTKTGYAWIAMDITALPQSESFIPVIVDAPSLSQQFPSLRGTWLKASVVTVSPGLNSKISAFYEVTALSNALIPASTFAVPKDYTTTDYTKPQAAGNRNVVPPPSH
jgi:hypothetical protein